MDAQINGGDCYRDASFSYLRSEQSSAQKTSATTGSTRTSFGLDRKKTTDQEGEISVFGAERYFNTALDDDHHHHHYHDPHDHDRDRRSSSGGKKQDHRDHDHHHDRQSNRPGTPSACSDVSWTSRSTALLLKASSGGLIRNPSRKSHNRKSRIINGSKTFFATLGCTGTCTDEKSVYVDNKQAANNHNHDHDDHDRHVAVAHDHHRLRFEAKSTKRSEDQHFAFPILSGSMEENSKTAATATKSEEAKEEVGVSVNVAAANEPPRMSLEVFGSKTAVKGANVLDEVVINLERKLSVLTWDAIPAKPYNNKVSPKASRPGSGRSGTGHEDMDSDASSDLFEIENITAGTMRRPLDQDTLSRCGTPNNNLYGHIGDYEPSETSIEWSVVTASAAADLGLDYDEKKLAANARPPTGQKPAPRRRPNSGILGCNSQKSVSVAETAHKTSGGNKEIKAILPNV